jgi:putative ABC transport system ATP-binding protein
MSVAVEQGTLVRCRAVGVTFGRVQALRDIDLSIEPGAGLALWGRSGSGKTTLLHVLGGLVEPTDGSIERGAALPAFVFQGANLLPHFSAYENVAFARRAAGRDGPDPEVLLGLVGLAGKLDSLPSELSGGEAQRVAIARALAQRPDLLLCDEPTGHLDSDTGERVLDLIEALEAELGFTLVIATHDADVAGRLDGLVTMRDGRLVD